MTNRRHIHANTAETKYMRGEGEYEVESQNNLRQTSGSLINKFQTSSVRSKVNIVETNVRKFNAIGEG